MKGRRLDVRLLLQLFLCEGAKPFLDLSHDDHRSKLKLRNAVANYLLVRQTGDAVHRDNMVSRGGMVKLGWPLSRHEPRSCNGQQLRAFIA
jgi:hypothetical protein